MPELGLRERAELEAHNLIARTWTLGLAAVEGVLATRINELLHEIQAAERRRQAALLRAQRIIDRASRWIEEEEGSHTMAALLRRELEKI